MKVNLLIKHLFTLDLNQREDEEEDEINCFVSCSLNERFDWHSKGRKGNQLIKSSHKNLKQNRRFLLLLILIALVQFDLSFLFFCFSIISRSLARLSALFLLSISILTKTLSQVTTYPAPGFHLSKDTD
jgi:hypothetical protein